MRRVLGFAAVLILTLSAQASARTWYVDDAGTGDAPTIQAGIDSSSTGDTVLVASGTYRGDGNRDLDLKGKAITVKSESDDPATCIIDCDGTLPEPHRGFHFHSGETRLSVVRGFKIINGVIGAAPGGGGILSESASPTIENCMISENEVLYRGGGVSCRGVSYPLFKECEISSNTAGDYGGGIYCQEWATATVEDCNITGNEADRGGGISTHDCSIVVTGCTVSGNSSEFGGGMVAYYRDPQVTECVFAGNVASFCGGGAYFCDCGTVEIGACTFVANNAGMGSGIQIDDTDLDLTNTIVAYGIRGEGVGWGNVSSASLACCDVYENEDGDYVGCIAGQEGINGNFSACPSFCYAGLDDFRLCDESPCAPGNHPDGYACGLIGALDVDCSCGPSAADGSSWGAIKAKYR